MSFEGKTAIITGAGGGIGECYAKRCANAGMKVVIAELNEEQGRRVTDEIEADGHEALFVRTDVGNEQSCLDCAAAVKARFGQIDYLVNNASIFGDMKIEGYLNVDVDMDYLNRFMAVTAHGCLLMARACVPHMPEGSAIVNQSSTAAWMHMGFYGVAKLTMNGASPPPWPTSWGGARSASTRSLPDPRTPRPWRRTRATTRRSWSGPCR